MRLFAQSSLGIDTGVVELFSEFEGGGSMWTRQGPRARSQDVIFSRPFQNAPVIQLGVLLWDVDTSVNFRAHTLAEDIRPDGFRLELRTWGDSRIARVQIGWTAFGPVADDSDWTL